MKKRVLAILSAIALISCSSNLETPVSNLYNTDYWLFDKENDVLIYAQYSTKVPPAGLDGEYLTSDDDVGSYTRTYCVENTNCEKPKYTYYFNNAGLDGLWFTADDEPIYMSRFEYGDGYEIEEGYRSAGFDGEWLSSDDELDGYKHMVTDGDITITNIYSGFGVDGIRGTNDDDLQSCQLTRNGDVIAQRYTGYTGEECSAIDIQNEDSYLVNSLYINSEVEKKNGFDVTVQTYWDFGKDEILKNEDDRIIQIAETRTLKVNSDFILGNSENRLRRIGPGSDGQWNTDDDIVDIRCNITVGGVPKISEHGISVCFESAGVDGLDFTEDDPVRDYKEITYTEDELGNVERIEKYFDQPGSDKKWFSNDDVLSVEYAKIIRVKL